MLFILLTGLSVVFICSSCSMLSSLSFFSARLHCLLDLYSLSCSSHNVAFVRVSVTCQRISTLLNHSIVDHSYLQYAKMLSLIRKISTSQQPKDNMDQQAKTDNVEDKHEDNQKEELDGTSYDPHADPRDSGSYYTFPHFAEE
jgi:hypothetical protein